MNDEPEQLRGGNMGMVTRQGDTVIRPAGDWTPAVHRLLRHLVAAGVQGVPVPLGITEDATEVLSFVEGVVPGYPMPSWVWSETALDSSARLLRRIHDATAGMRFDGPWRSPVREPAEVVCHNDFATYNLVFDGDTVVGAIDWDFASPGPRLWDIAYLAYRIVPLSSRERGDGFTDGERALRLDRLLAAYGSAATPHEVLGVLRERLVALAAFSEAMAVELDNPELREHAVLYRDDAAQLVTRAN
ncbi:phosphotransferase [Tessaracoccus sp. G1721]